MTVGQRDRRGGARFSIVILLNPSFVVLGVELELLVAGRHERNLTTTAPRGSTMRWGRRSVL